MIGEKGADLVKGRIPPAHDSMSPVAENGTHDGLLPLRLRRDVRHRHHRRRSSGATGQPLDDTPADERQQRASRVNQGGSALG